MSKTVKHLYDGFKPSNYDLSFNIDKQKLTFTGSVIITGKKTGRPSKRLTFHQKDLKIQSATIVKMAKKSQEAIDVARILTHKSYDEVRLHTNQDLYAGDYQITINFSGNITDSMLGIYPSVFTHKGAQKTIIATQFESHHAREAFPCIDEPQAKATFDLTLTSAKDDVAISNMPSISETIDGKKMTTVFKTTPIMSTYLLAFVTGPLHYVEAKTKDDVTVRTWASLARPKEELRYSLNEAVRVLEFFTDYFGVPYPLEKCDQVALPDFDSGAMENWGLITYREIALLSDPKNPSISGEQYISLVIAHELSHQWFGNLVTMKWWDDLWLNESFASIMEFIALDTLHPDWHQWESYTASDVISSSSRDVYKDVQPVGVKVTDPELISTLFDPAIVYAKGGRLIKMLREYIGDDVFRKGLTAYFNKHAYKNTSRADLWEAMSQASGKDISALMTPWIEQSGMPVVEVNQADKKINFSQQRLVLDNGDDPTLWPIPLLANLKLSKDILSKSSATYVTDQSMPIIINQLGSGHYFTLYKGKAHQKYIASAIANRSIPPETRINLLNDSLMLARGGYSPLTDTLELIAKCDSEDRDNVWALISRSIGLASQLTEGHEVTDSAIKILKQELASGWYEKLGWDDKRNDNANTKQLRHTVIAFMLSAENQPAIDTALERLNNSSELASIDAELRPSILSAAVRHGDKDTVAKLINEYQNSSSDIQLDITSALSSTKDASQAKNILNQALGDDGFVRAQDIMRWIAMFLRNRHTRLVAWNYVVSQWDWLESVLSKNKSFDYLPVYCANVMNSTEWEKRYHKLFEPKLADKTLERNIKVGFSDIAARVAWRKRDEQLIVDFFKDRSKS